MAKVVAGAALMCAFAYDHRQALGGSLQFTWLLLVDPEPISDRAYTDRLRLALLCPLLSLQLFPMAGEQVLSGLLPMTAAAVLLADGANSLDAHVSRRTGQPSPVSWPARQSPASGLLIGVGRKKCSRALQTVAQLRVHKFSRCALAAAAAEWRWPVDGCFQGT